MRALGPSIVVLALVLSAGGVAYRTQAGPQLAVETDAANDPPAEQQCEVVDEAPPKPFSLDLSKLPAQAGDAVMPLNRTGYNYREPGLWQPPLKVAPGAEDSEPAAPRD